jgi:hypothetical protein
MADKIWPVNLNFKELFSTTNLLRLKKNQRKNAIQVNIDVDKEVLRAQWYFLAGKMLTKRRRIYREELHAYACVYGSVYGIKTKRTCWFGESGIGRTSLQVRLL